MGLTVVGPGVAGAGLTVVGEGVAPPQAFDPPGEIATSWKSTELRSESEPSGHLQHGDVGGG